MSTREIPREEWGEFFRKFNRMHLGWLCSLDISSPAIGAKLQAHDLPFAEIDADLRGPEAPIRITLGDARGARISHAIDGVRHLYLSQTRDGVDDALEIDGDKVHTLVDFHVEAPAA